LLVATALSVCLINSAHASEPIRCTCQFEQSSGYEAVGTRGACSTMTHKNMKGKGEHCEISFGGTGSQAPLISRLTTDPNYRSLAFRLTDVNLRALFTQDFQPVSEASYLREAIPAYLRAVYAREGAQLDEGTRLDLDKQVLVVAEKYAGPIAEVFQGKREPFETTVEDQHRLTDVRGALRFVYKDINLVAVFFDLGPAR
jgi:hypothetical protein